LSCIFQKVPDAPRREAGQTVQSNANRLPAARGTALVDGVFVREVSLHSVIDARVRAGRLLDRVECRSRLTQLRFERFASLPCLRDRTFLSFGGALCFGQDLSAPGSKLRIRFLP
jgi:hypothetical protein